MQFEIPDVIIYTGSFHVKIKIVFIRSSNSRIHNIILAKQDTMNYFCSNIYDYCETATGEVLHIWTIWETQRSDKLIIDKIHNTRCSLCHSNQSFIVKNVKETEYSFTFRFHFDICAFLFVIMIRIFYFFFLSFTLYTVPEHMKLNKVKLYEYDIVIEKFYFSNICYVIGKSKST